MKHKSAIRQLALWGLRMASPRRQLLVRGKSTCRSVHLTFDDGPCPLYTPRILDTLRRHRATATFFVVGQQAEQNVDLIYRIFEEGHEIGGHTYSHCHRKNITFSDLRIEIEKTDEVLRSIIGHSTRLFRPPFGKLKAVDLPALWSSGRTVVLWSRDPRDYATNCIRDLKRWFEIESLAEGDIVLLHDTCKMTADSLDDILTVIGDRGLAFSGCCSAIRRSWRLD